MKTRVLYFIGCIIIIGFVSSCSSIRRLKSSSETGGLVKREYIEKLVSQTSEWAREYKYKEKKEIND